MRLIRKTFYQLQPHDYETYHNTYPTIFSSNKDQCAQKKACQYTTVPQRTIKPPVTSHSYTDLLTIQLLQLTSCAYEQLKLWALDFSHLFSFHSCKLKCRGMLKQQKGHNIGNNCSQQHKKKSIPTKNKRNDC